MKSKTSENFIASESNGVKRDQQLKQKQLKSGKTFCQSCKKKCSGEVLRVQDKYFHIGCFKCAQCNASLAQGGFFAREGSYYCTKDYRERWGTKCAGCGEYVEGDVVTAGDKHAFHPNCFHCQRCRQPLLGQGTKVSLVQGQALCHRCVGIPVREASTPVGNSSATRGSGDGPSDPGACAGCGNQLREGQALVALDRQWHVWCFKCHTCDTVLHGEYMGKDGVPYCEKDYQKQFGVKCAYCNRYISGKVLQAGDNHHFHPTCARCTKCGDPFGDGEEMYLQGAAIWHPRCGPGPSGPNGIVNGHGEAHTPQHRESERISSSASEMQFSLRSRTPSLNGSLCSPYSSLSRKYYPARTGSPGLILREYGRGPSEDVSRIYTYSYLTETPSQGYLRRPIQPYDKPPTSPHFHRPSSSRSIRSSGGRSSRSGMRALVDALSETRPKSPASQVDNDEPIELAHYPDAMKPPPGTKPPIERDDFPAPPYPYTDPERRRRWSDTYKGVPASDDEDEVDNKTYIKEVEEKLKKEQDELSKIDTGIAKVFLQDREKDRENLRHKAANVDPRNASRTPSAAREPTYRLRYESPVGASPSRNIDHARPWEDDDGFSYRSSVGPSYNVGRSSARSPAPRNYPPLGTQRAFTLPNAARHYHSGDYSFSGMGDKTHSTDFSSGKSDISTGSITDVDRRALVCTTAPYYSRRISMNDGGMLPSSTTYTGGLGSVVGSHGGHHVRRSLPDMGTAPSEPPKLYPYHLLVITNYRLPADVDRCNLERHLSDAEFEAVLQFTRAEFYRLPQWRRNEIKRRARLF
ncbi:actin-binding LIM protein 2 isoform X1 [Bombus vosnesenskii]|uniref:Actin-binding LIM protein 2 isoform X1 n=3 Tax=Pyrobombus TaxID=144703 RepID=A0A6J3L5L6_9HYME|nr:actin-binding LIM protein 2 isoform X1 [Bombus impatiens]XP_012241518.1 actin-binding LIM protein 2 isoform X2 [Bombus impatiens]XP_033189319.1 actin-binding LIM protein 2 isoform X1 [Bombus vancouverensis nearcticus]XP_033310274.1 actin-binding LIM protein 2 isoform X1 [Bombus bifarius]XP_033360918.1 actin-binding LIM protein 2 isoform X1 [Bombus vosnesenskii]XP_043583999.1 actin-binding LIM protein 2 isoform X1 [Bombus pyrosoma]XP_050481915.1 actin-binding LIM protein 2 isoform X1 [Bombu